MQKIEIVEGLDISKLLGIKKWEPSQDASFNTGIAKGNFPSYLPKTDETRIQSIPWILKKYLGKKVFITEKLDGASISLIKYNNIIHVCSRNLDLREDNEHCKYWKTIKKLNLNNILLSSNIDNISIQGEICGPSIQKNKYKFKDFQIYFFNAYNIDTQNYLNYSDFIELADELNIQLVPLLDTFQLNHTVDELVEYSKGESILYPIQREGIVVRPIEEIYDEKIGRVSFKVINPDFLLKYDE